MTYTYEKLANYIGKQIEQMNSYIDYIKGKENLEIGVKRTWALDFVRSQNDQAFGALNFSVSYTRDIDDETFEKLANFLKSGTEIASERIWKEI